MKLFPTIVLASLTLCIASAAIAQSSVNPTDPNYVEQLSTPSLRNVQPNYVYSDNSQTSVEKFNANKQRIELRKLNTGLQLKSVKLLKYSDYIESRKQFSADILENLQVHPNRQVFLVEIDAPNGVEIPSRGGNQKIADPINNNVKQGTQKTKLKKAKLLYVFDAESGDFLNSDINEISE